jgi:D-alanyl-D-alanine carboxypeptidase (penicillin-binding protein 5/6)
MMTLLVAVNAGDLNQQVTIGPDAAALVNSQNSYMGVSTGEKMSLRDLLYGIIVASGNDAAVAISDYIGGSEASFVAIMNRYARQLGLRHTVFVSPDGADDGNKSSARDLAILGAVLMEHPEVAKITSTPYYQIPQTDAHQSYDLWATNDLLPGGGAPYTGANGIKTGFTGAAQYCMAFSAQAQGHLIVGVVLGDPSSPARNSDAHALLDWAFSQE